MKKLFTLLALLTCFLGANAIEKVDVEIDFTTQETLWGWGAGWNADANSGYFDLDGDGLHFTLDEAKSNNYDIQLQPFPSVNDLDASYTVEITVKGNPAGDQTAFWLAFSGSETPGWVETTATFETLTFTDVVNNPNAQYFANSGSLLLQAGHYVGEFWIKSIKISHEEKVEEVDWENILVNGDASAAWANPDAQTVDNKYDGEGAELVSAYGKEYGYNNNNPHAALIEDGVFVCKTQPVDPPLVWEEDGEQWGQKHSAGDPKPDNVWQNQFWINYPRPLADGEPVKLSFRYKASKDARVTTQDHRAPGDYVGGGKVGELKFTTEWQTYEGQWDAAAGIQSLAFNLGEDQQYEQDIIFYFDDLSLQVQKLEEGWFVAGTDPDDSDPAYDFDNAVKFELDGEDYVATIGGENEDEWVKEVMISTKKGTDKGFKAATIAVDTETPIMSDPADWHGYEAKGKATVALPVLGMWKIRISAVEGENLISFEKLVGEEELPELEVIPNETEVTLHGLARESHEWDNQFWIAGNRSLKKGEKVYVKFDYYASEDGVNVATQSHGKAKDADGNEVGDPTNYISHGLLGDLTFNVEPQTFEKVVEITDNGTWSICFNMAYPDHEVDYTITNVVWMNDRKTERLVDPEDEGIFWLKVGEGTPVQYPAVPLPAPKPNANGDKDDDGNDIIDVSDIDFIIEYIDQEVNEENAGADTNRDGKIDVADIDTVIEAIK